MQKNLFELIIFAFKINLSPTSQVKFCPEKSDLKFLPLISNPLADNGTKISEPFFLYKNFKIFYYVKINGNFGLG